MRTPSGSAAQGMHYQSVNPYVPTRLLVSPPGAGSLSLWSVGVVPSGRPSFWVALDAPCKIVLSAIWHNGSYAFTALRETILNKGDMEWERFFWV